MGRFRVGNLAANSLFELTITENDGRLFRGTVSDVLGDAIVEGETSNDTISFVKTYGDMRGPGNFVPLLYTATQNTQGLYEGRWSPVSSNGQGPRYMFRMVPFAPEAIRALG